MLKGTRMVKSYPTGFSGRRAACADVALAIRSTVE
jgi:hypothetical protein